MKRIIMIMGPMASGKTTIANRLGEYMKLKVVHIDEIYNNIASETGINTELLLDKIFKNKDINKITLDTINYDIIKKLREEMIRQEVKGLDEFIIEGSQLNLKSIRDMIVSVAGINRIVPMIFIPSYDDWIRNMNGKKGHHVDIQKWDEWKKFYYKQISNIEFPDYYYLFESDRGVCVEYNNYQREDFSREKFNRLKIDNEIKGNTVLDLGCNSGYIGYMAKAFGASRYLGLDFNWRHLEDCVSKGVSGAKYDLREFADNWLEKYDVVVCLATIHYIDEKEKFIERISKITNKLFVLEVPVYNGGETGLPKQEDVEKWLNKYFNKVEYIGESVSPSPQPEYSKRLIYKSYVKSN